MTVSCIEEIYSKYINRARNAHPDLFRESYSPHSMRHTTATHMLEAGVPLIVVKKLFGTCFSSNDSDICRGDTGNNE